MINTLYFLFPFLLYLGIAVQGLSYYLIAIIIPSLIFILNRKKIPTIFKQIGCAFLFLHIIFPLVNFLIYFFPNKNVNPTIYKIEMQWPGILQSNFPSTFMFGGLALIVLHFASKKYSHKASVMKDKLRNKGPGYDINFQPLRSFLLGLTFASFLFMCLMFFQHFTGIDLHTIFRKKIEYLGKDEAFKTGGFRAWGFYGHPLTIAGVCLSYSIFAWTLLCYFIANKKNYTWNFIPFKNAKSLPFIILAIIAFSNEICLLLSGGRTAAAVGIFLFIVIPLIFNFKKNAIATLAVIIIIISTSIFAAKKFGILNRIENVTKSIEKKESFEEGNYRQYFWKVYLRMFSDNPTFGQGNYWLKQGVREEYYNKMGLGTLPQKYIAHNNLLEILGSVGLFGFIWISAGLFYLFRSLKKEVFQENSPLLPLAIPIFLSFIANLLHSFTQNVFFDSSVVYIYICLLLVILWEYSVSKFYQNP